jgi:transcriptional regulator with XRE-family HTH domain
MVKYETKDKFLYDMLFSENVKKLIELHKVNTYILAGLLDLKPSSVSELLSGKTHWKLSQVVSIAEYFNVKLDKLFFDDEDYIEKLYNKNKIIALQKVKDFLVKEKKFNTYGKLEAEGYFDELKGE